MQMFLMAIALVNQIGTTDIDLNPNRSQLGVKNPNAIAQSNSPTPGVGWPITTSSGANEIRLARHLRQSGVKMYGAWWCPHCHEQKMLFGKEAFRQITYVECDLDGQNPNPALCVQLGIKSFPTWEINGRLTRGGVENLQTLAQLSGYPGPRNFKYVLQRN
ncbi:MAG: hypothetical protein KME17_10880 [Cyanosarcina radialis HA8281-LM2]|jgi:glutaredoxin|nr:hypothetical protein [Cyanosarcina radialis HA8281-LM2]